VTDISETDFVSRLKRKAIGLQDQKRTFLGGPLRPHVRRSTIFHERPLLVRADIRAGNSKSMASNGC
jgi:hypothetical protein